MATNPLDKVYLSQAQLNTIADGGSITDSSSNEYTADLGALYLTDAGDEGKLYLHTIVLEDTGGGTFVRMKLYMYNNSSTAITSKTASDFSAYVLSNCCITEVQDGSTWYWGKVISSSAPGYMFSVGGLYIESGLSYSQTTLTYTYADVVETIVEV